MAEQLHRELAAQLQTLALGVPPAAVTISGVDLSGDLRSARVHISLLDPAQAAAVLGKLAQHAGELRHTLGQRLSLRWLPRLQFVHDPTQADGARIEELLAAARSREGV